MLKELITSTLLTICILTQGHAATTTTVSNDLGGSVQKMSKEVIQMIYNGDKVVVDGLCHSACTMHLALNENLCVTPKAVFSFHAVTSIFPPTQKASDRMTQGMVLFYPEGVQRWFWDNVGLRNYYGAVQMTGEELIEVSGGIYSRC